MYIHSAHNQYFIMYNMYVHSAHLIVAFFHLQGPEVIVSTELLHSSKLVPILMKCKTRRSLAATLVASLIDKQTRLKSNVRGRGKEPLNPTVIEYVKQKCFETFPSTGDPKDEWEKCIITIDEKSRDLKRQLKKKQQKEQQQNV